MSDLKVLYDAHFQRNFAAFMLRDATFLERVANEVVAGMFSDENYARVVRLILDFWRHNKGAPGTNVFHVLDGWKQQHLISDEVHTVCSKLCDELFAVPLHNRAYILGQFDGFLKHQLFETAFPKVVDLVRRGEFDVAEQTVKNVFTSRSSYAGEAGIYVNDNVEARTRDRESEERDRLMFLIPPLDKYLRGSLPGELGVWQSQQSSAGKSAALVQQARNYALQGRNVAVYTLEMSQRAYEDRFDQCISGLRRDDVLDELKLRTSLQSFLRMAGKILIKKFPPYTTKASTIRDHLRFEESMSGLKFDAVLVDYADLLAPETNTIRGDLYATGAEVYSYLSEWAMTDHLHMWTAMQSNREAMKETHADQKDAGGSIAKMQIADMVLSINRTPEEAQNKRTRLHVVKNRHGAARFDICFPTDFERMQFWSAALDEDWQGGKVP